METGMATVWRWVLVSALLAGLVTLTPVNPVAAADGIVENCDEPSFNAALAGVQGSGGGEITFACSGTISFTSEKTITSDVTITGNGGIVFDGGDSVRLFQVDSGASLTLDTLTLQNGSAIDGGAIYNEVGTVTISNSTLSGNSATGESGSGGAISNDDGTLTITDSTLSGNAAREGGAIDSDGGVVEITDSILDSNSATSVNQGGFGGAIGISSGMLTIATSTLSANNALNNGGAIAAIDSTLVITASTLRHNMASSAGAIDLFGGTTTIENSTLSGNEADNDGDGGAVYNFSGTLTVTASTLADNRSDFEGAALVSDGTAVTTFAASIVAMNTALNDVDCLIYSGTITSLGSNLSDNASCPFTATGDIQNSANVNLGPLQNNGGPTETMAPAGNSDAVDNADCSLSTPDDQRGIVRPVGSSCDIGAVEVEIIAAPTYALCASFYTGAVKSPLSGNCGAGTAEITPFDQTFCIDVYTSKLLYLFGRPCDPPRLTHTMPDDGDLLTCVSLYTGANRWVYNHSQCKAYELPNTIPASP